MEAITKQDILITNTKARILKIQEQFLQLAKV